MKKGKRVLARLPAQSLLRFLSEEAARHLACVALEFLHNALLGARSNEGEYDEPCHEHPYHPEDAAARPRVTLRGRSICHLITGLGVIPRAHITGGSSRSRDASVQRFI